MKIGILQTGHLPDELSATQGVLSDLFERMLGGHGFVFETWAVVDDQFPETVEDAHAWVITGSKHGAYEDLPWIRRLEDFIRAAYAHEKRIVGICFGHQVIAKALGGTVEKWDGGWSVGRQSYSWQGEEVHLNAWHQDQVTKRPADATVLAANSFCENAALVYGDTILTVQAHPEFDASLIEGLADHRSDSVPPALVTEARAALDKDVDNGIVALKLARFLKTGKTA